MQEGPVDSQKVTLPQVSLSEEALRQLSLIIENDFTLKGKYLRLLISGKGCDGFTYSVGFTDLYPEDMRVPVQNPTSQMTGKENIEVVMDPFTAFYLQETLVDYVQDFANNNEGFVVVNKNQKSYSGKFWRQDSQKVPPVKEDLSFSSENS